MLAQLQPGAIFAQDFRVVRPLSQGGMGAVYVVEQLSTGNQRALKLMHPQLVTNAELRQRFVQEAKVGARIKSDHVVQVVAAGVDGELPWLAMELLEGDDLARVLARRGALPVDEVREIFGQLCHALGAAHAVNIVHRDLKPENVFLADSRRAGVPFTVKVLDYGIAKLVADVQTHHTSALGTPLWMAPEQTEAGGNICAATDVWALGLLAFRMLTGSYYWRVANGETSSAMALMREVVFEPLVPASARAAEYGRTVPRGFDEWFARCVVREIPARFSDARAAGDALDALLRAAPMAMPMTVAMSATPGTPAPTIDVARPIPPAPTFVPSPHEPTRRATIPLPLIVGASLAVLLVGGSALLVVKSGEPSKPRGKAVTAVSNEIVEKPSHKKKTTTSETTETTETSETTETTETSELAQPPPEPQAPLAPTPGTEKGTGTVKDAGAVVSRNRWRFKACYDKALAIDPSDGGKVSVVAVVDSDGNVTSTKASSTTASPGLTSCIVSAFSSMKFSPPEGGSTATIDVPVVLSKK